MIINRVTLLGNKDHGKSTLIGSMLMLTKSVTKERIAEARRVSRSLNRRFEPGFILDSFSEEREGGLTIDTTRAQIKYRNAAFELIDVPGHEELIQNMISGASYASFAILIISAKKGERITTQTKRHLFLAKMLGIRSIAIAVNKMDTVGYSRVAFESIKDEMEAFLGSIGFSSGSISFIPVSAYDTDNIITRSKHMSWYKGMPLLQTMAKFSGMKRERQALRVSVQGSIAMGSEELITGKVLSGRISRGARVVLFPDRLHSRVEAIYVKGRPKGSASAGEDIALRLDRKPGRARGHILCGEDSKPMLSASIESTVFFIKKPSAAVTVKYNGMDLPVRISVHRIIDMATGRELPKSSKIVLNAAKATIKANRIIAFEEFGKCPELGRFTIYTKSGFSGIGIIGKNKG